MADSLFVGCQKLLTHPDWRSDIERQAPSSDVTTVVRYGLGDVDLTHLSLSITILFTLADLFAFINYFGLIVFARPDNFATS